MSGTPEHDFSEINNKEIKEIINLLPESKKKILIDWINNLLLSRYDAWASSMGEDL